MESSSSSLARRWQPSLGRDGAPPAPTPAPSYQWQPLSASTTLTSNSNNSTSISSLLNASTTASSSSSSCGGGGPYAASPYASTSEAMTPEALSPVSTATLPDHYPSCSPAGHHHHHRRPPALKINIRDRTRRAHSHARTVPPSPSSSGATTPVYPAFRSDDEAPVTSTSTPATSTPTTTGRPLGRPRSAVRPAPAIQRERNRVAATKCRAKTKEAISKLEEHERAVSDRREYLSAEKAALTNEVLALRLELLRHSKCPVDVNIQNYLRNAAVMIGQTGGTHKIWGPDGSGRLWPVEEWGGRP